MFWNGSTAIDGLPGSGSGSAGSAAGASVGASSGAVSPDGGARLRAVLLHLADEAESALVDGADHLLRAAVVADRAPRRADARVERRVRHHAPLPHRLEQLVLADDAIAVLQQIGEHVEHLRLDRHGLRRRSAIPAAPGRLRRRRTGNSRSALVCNHQAANAAPARKTTGEAGSMMAAAAAEYHDFEISRQSADKSRAPQRRLQASLPCRPYKRANGTHRCAPRRPHHGPQLAHPSRKGTTMTIGHQLRREKRQFHPRHVIVMTLGTAAVLYAAPSTP